MAMAVIWLATFLVLILSSFLKNHGVELSIEGVTFVTKTNKVPHSLSSLSISGTSFVSLHRGVPY